MYENKLTTRIARVNMLERIIQMTGVEMIKMLKKNGIYHFKIKGSHYHYNINNKIFQVPHHHKEMGKGLKNKILKDAGLLNEKEYIDE